MKLPEPECAPELGCAAPADTIAQSSGTPQSPLAADAASRTGGSGFILAGTRPTIAAVGRFGSWHLPVGQTLANLCETLNGRNVNYVVLLSATGEGPALLVADQDIPRMRDLLTHMPFGRQLAVYATTDLPGFSFQQHWRHITDATNMAVLPPYLAEGLLERAITDEDGLHVPSPGDLLNWVIYCALYLSGDQHFTAGGASDASPLLVGAAAGRIRDLAQAARVDLREPFTLAALHEHLAAAGWAPSYDVLRRLSSWNSWAHFKAGEREAEMPVEEPGFVAFFIRRQSVVCGLQDDLARMLADSGFELLKTIDLDAEQTVAAARATRGANWGPGRFRVTGGPPSTIIFALDLIPLPVPSDLRGNYPFLDNERVLRAKQFSRGLICDRLPRRDQFNPLHSTDESRDAWRIVRMFAPGEELALREIIAKRKADFATDYEVVRDLTRTGVRAKIELIRYRDGLAVKKTYRQTSLRFMDREAAFMEDISPHRPEILPVLERGTNYLIMPYVEGRPLRRALLGVGIPRLMTLGQIGQVADLLRYLFSRGYDPIDLAPHNLLVDRLGKLTAIDFEFVHRTDVPIEPERSACLNGLPDGFEGDWPLTARWWPERSKARMDPYRLRWLGYTALTRESFLHDRPSVQRLKRLLNYPRYMGAKALERQYQWLRNRAKKALKNRLPVVTRMATRALRSKVIRA